MQLERAERKRDLRLRRRLLQVMHAVRVRPEQGWIQGRFMMDLVNDSIPGRPCFTSDDHASALLRDLVAGGYAEHRDDRWKKHQPECIDFASYRITHRGTALVEQQIDPDPLVEDDRLPSGAAR